ncbi:MULTISPECIES: thioesterase domain-containing protein [Streptomyces]|uniref:Thioesterase domain-containing protein n=1 Tax=Streptomyces lonegramiae TaxID=3075524 RepID=A0ABU2XAC4_9ACTN|nr:thioesterase domain-containing protein [Streptomyces sp. DSM 41529]MDT0542858.1 thioesterase domain-containing protein [Streptomyces sp. DSM 41529]
MRIRIVDGHLLIGDPRLPLRVFLFHYAGATALSMLPLARALPPGCAAVAFELDGRGELADTPPARGFDDAVKRLFPAFRSWVDRPAVVVGHGVGALLAHALVAELPDGQRHHLRDVVLSGARSPVTTARVATHPRAPFLTRTREELTAELRRHGGCPPELFDYPHMLDLAVTMLGQDLHLMDTYHEPAAVPPGGRTDYHVWSGRGDRSLSAAESERWRLSTPSPPQPREFAGGHVFLCQERPPAAALRELVAARIADITDIADVPPCPERGAA